MKNGMIIAGNMLVDALKDVDVYPEHSHLTTIRRVRRATGGLVCNCALDLARLDRELPITVVGAIGDDDNGRFIREVMGRYPNISLAGVKVIGQTSFTDAMCDLTNRTRTFFTFRGASGELVPSDFDFSALPGDILHIGYMLLLDGLDALDPEFGTAMARVLASAKAAGKLTSVDLVSEESDRYKTIVPPALRYTDYCVINETEAERITGISISRSGGYLDESTAHEALDRLFEMGVSRWAVIHSRNESVGSDGQSYARVPSIDISREIIAGTTGAGDAFCSGVLYGAYRGMELTEAMQFATAVATASLLEPGASDGVLTYDQTVAFRREYINRYGEVRL